MKRTWRNEINPIGYAVSCTALYSVQCCVLSTVQYCVLYSDANQSHGASQQCVWHTLVSHNEPGSCRDQTTSFHWPQLCFFHFYPTRFFCWIRACVLLYFILPFWLPYHDTGRYHAGMGSSISMKARFGAISRHFSSSSTVTRPTTAVYSELAAAVNQSSTPSVSFLFALRAPCNLQSYWQINFRVRPRTRQSIRITHALELTTHSGLQGSRNSG